MIEGIFILGELLFFESKEALKPYLHLHLHLCI